MVRLGQILATGADQIATSAVIMGGDSGGPLVDLDGRLIGIGSRVKTIRRRESERADPGISRSMAAVACRNRCG